MNRKNDDIVGLFEDINEANIKAGDTFQINRLAPFLSELQTGNFFLNPVNEQIDRLGDQCEAYIGRGEILRGLINKGYLPSSFGDTMKITCWKYILSLDISEPRKKILKEKLTKLLQS